jgi:hypothetical protein
MSAEALEPCRLTAIQVKEFLGFLEKYPDAAREATRCVLHEYQAILSDICRLALPATVAGRLANLLLDWLKKRAQAEHATPRFTMSLTQKSPGWPAHHGKPSAGYCSSFSARSLSVSKDRRSPCFALEASRELQVVVNVKVSRRCKS